MSTDYEPSRVIGAEEETRTQEQALMLVEPKSMMMPFSGASAALAAQVMASVQARYLVAERHPRDMAIVRLELLEECANAEFASAARYRKPMGRDHVDGLSIRFAETATAKMGNIFTQATITHEDGERRFIKVSVTDLERNVYYDYDVVVRKTVERRHPKQGVRIISSRTNSAGQVVHLVEATDDELEIKQAAMISKVVRNLKLKLLPVSLKKECEAAVVATLEKQSLLAPDATRARLVAAFASSGIDADALSRYLGHPVDEITTKEVVDLRAVYQTIVEEQTTWGEILAEKIGQTDAEAPTVSSKAEEIKNRVRSMNEKEGEDDGRS